MSDNSQGKPFKTLKLTSLKTADAANAPVTPTAVPPDANAAEPTSTAPAESGVFPQVKPADASGGRVPSAPAASGSFSLHSFKPVTPTDSAGPPKAGSTSGGARPELSPSAAVSGRPGLKPFNTLVPSVNPAVSPGAADAGAQKPQEIKLARASSPRIDGPAASPGASADAPPALPESLAPRESVETPVTTAVARPPMRPMVAALVIVVVLLVAGVGATVFLSSRVSSSAKAPAPAVTPTESAEVVSPDPAVPSETPPETVKTPAVSAPRTRDPALEAWLAEARVTTVASQRVTLNERIYSLNSAVNPEGTLKWIGRDSVTKDLLFIDKAGVIYTKSVGGGR